MNSGLTRVNSISREYTGNQTFPQNLSRSYFFIVMTSGTGTIEFGNGGGKIPLQEGFHYAPHIVPTTEITVETSGTFVIHSAGGE